METLTAAQVLALAPDPASARAGQSLAGPAKWSAPGRNTRSVWGECQGSALYRTQVDLGGPAFHCSCPSRKFPCKHGLGLLLLLATAPVRVPEATPPAWVEAWIAKRDADPAKKTADPAAAPAIPEAPARRDAEREKRAAKREDRVRAGLAELQTWLGDLVRQGFAHAREQPARFFDAMAARMIDAQAPGVARRLRTWPGIFASGEAWADRALEETGALQWLLNGAARLDTLPAPLRASVRAAVGWTTSEQDLLANPDAERIDDRWQIVGQRVEEEDRLRTQRTWLVGERSRRAALCLSFAAGNQPLDVSLVPGRTLDATLVFHPSAAPLRASVAERRDSTAGIGEAAAWEDFEEAARYTAGWVSTDPWLERAPWFVRGCLPVRGDGGNWRLRDAAGNAVDLAREFAQPWPLLAVSGGRPVTVFGEWNGRVLLPLGVVAEGRFVALGREALP